jgi:methylaspartate mutase epsilon subunit
MELRDVFLDRKEFDRSRKEVLAQWPTGRDVDLEDAVGFHKRMSEAKNAATVLRSAKKARRLLITPKAGFATIDQQRQTLQILQELGQADILPSSVDTYTRSGFFEKAEKAVNESEKMGRSMLNGFPIVTHGVEKIRQLIGPLKVPLLVRCTGADVRLIWEIALAGGYSGGPGTDLNYYVTGTKKDPLDVVISNYRYVERLCGIYTKMGVPVYRDIRGGALGTIIPSSLYNAIAVLSALMIARQGVKFIGLNCYMNCSVRQDLAGGRSLDNLVREYLDRYGYNDVETFLVLETWNGVFPQDEGRAYAVMAYCALMGIFLGASLLNTKTSHQSHGIATPENNAMGVRFAKMLANYLQDRRMELTSDILEEEAHVESETRAIVEKVLEVGNGDVVVGVMRAFERGFLDFVFCPNSQCANKVMPMRDLDGVVRYLDPGLLPLTSEMASYHRDKIHQRTRSAGVAEDETLDLVIEDVSAGACYFDTLLGQALSDS